MLELADDDLAALFLGRLEDPKNEAWLVDLAAASRQSLPNLRVLLAGEGPNEKAVKSLVQQQGVDDRVRLLGQREPLPLLQAADALLLPSARRGFLMLVPRRCARAFRFFARKPAGRRR